MSGRMIFAAFAVFLGGCAAPGGAGAPDASPAPGSSPVRAEAGQSFSAWQGAFRARALGAGIRPDVIDRAFAGVTPNPEVKRLDRYQPEFSRPIWEYLDSAVSASRVSKGRQLRAEKQADLSKIEAQYGVPREIVLAIWGMESAYGANYGSSSVIRSLATLAWEGRRRDFAEEQLIAALRIIQAGDVTPERMVGSWAGAMGHTQFMPTSFLGYAVDFDGDGRRDLWSASARDALASTANYLARFGWRRGEPWGWRLPCRAVSTMRWLISPKNARLANGAPWG